MQKLHSQYLYSFMSCEDCGHASGASHSHVPNSAGYAASDMVQANPIVATFWGILFFKVS